MVNNLKTGLAASAALASAACASIPPADISAMRFVEAAGVHTHVQQWGLKEGKGEPILLIHGASSDLGVWAPTIVPRLEGRFQLSAYDRPGMGYTTQRPADANTLAEQAKVAAGVIDQLHLKKPIVVAHSWGGAVALRLALDYPDKVGGLILIAPVAYEWPGGVSWHLYWSSNPVVGGLFNNVLVPPFSAAAIKSGVAGAFAPSPVPENYLEKAGSARAVRPAALLANSLDMITAKREIIAQQSRYPEIKIPVALMTGDSDSVVSPTIHSVQLAQTLPNARIDVLQGVGHLPHEASPERFEKLLEWVRAEMKRS
jgi:pimeloyl-ACP methyl ester carboxylesterase